MFVIEREVFLLLALSVFTARVALLAFLATAGTSVGVLAGVAAGVETTMMWISGRDVRRQALMVMVQKADFVSREDTTYATILGITKNRCNVSERNESNEERLQCKRQEICTPHGIQYPILAMTMPEHQFTLARNHI